MWEYRATRPAIGGYNDGDTVRLLVDVGFTGRMEVDVRLAYVMAPEARQAGGKEAARYVLDWLHAHSGDGTRRWPYRLITTPNTAAEPTERRTFARWVGVVYSMASGECLNDRLRGYLAEHPEWGAGTGG